MSGLVNGSVGILFRVSARSFGKGTGPGAGLLGLFAPLHPSQTDMCRLCSALPLAVMRTDAVLGGIIS